ncbi:MAG: NAD(P)-dependent oxidoreductase [Patescibacteria group bacterium]
MKIIFFETKDWEKDYLKNQLSVISDQAELVFFSEKFDKSLCPKDAEAISLFVGSELKAEDVNDLPNLKLITTRSTGFDHLEYQALSEKGIKLGYVPGYGNNTVAEFAFGLLLAVARKIFNAFDQIKEQRNFSIEGFEGFDLMGKTIGIIGTGRIGTQMIKIANGFSMKVIAFDKFPKPELEKELNFKYVSFDGLLEQAEVISLHLPYTPENHHLINEQAIAKMKDGAVIINTARGGLIDTKALLTGLNSGKIGGAGIDVLEGEQAVFDEQKAVLYGRPNQEDLLLIAENNLLINHPNVVMTPHIAFYTREALQRILDTDIENIKTFVQTGEPKFSIVSSSRFSSGASGAKTT